MCVFSSFEESRYAGARAGRRIDRVLTQDEFANSIFELVDAWTESVELDEYVNLLASGYARVFGEVVSSDGINFPDCWCVDANDEDSTHDTSEDELMPEGLIMDLVGEVRSTGAALKRPLERERERERERTRRRFPTPRDPRSLSTRRSTPRRRSPTRPRGRRGACRRPTSRTSRSRR